MIKEFTIILVDDDVPAMGEQIREIQQYLTGEKKIDSPIIHPIHVKEESDFDKVDEYLKNHIDLILTDNSMINPDDGLNLAKRIRDKLPLVDILLYSAKPIEKSDYRDLSHYTQIQTYDEKKITEITKNLIDKNLSKWDDVIFLRGILISESIVIESKMNSILSKFFAIPENKKVSFENLILGNFSVSLEAKKVELKGVLSEVGRGDLWNNISEKIRKLQEIRNKLAHGKIDPEDHHRFVMGNSDEIINKEKIISRFSDIADIKKKLSEIEKELN